MKKLIKAILYSIIALVWFYFLLFIFAGIKDTSKDGWAGDNELIVQDISGPKRGDND